MNIRCEQTTKIDFTSYTHIRYNETKNSNNGMNEKEMAEARWHSVRFVMFIYVGMLELCVLRAYMCLTS